MPVAGIPSCPLCQSARVHHHLGASDASRSPQVGTYRCTSPEYGRHPQILRCRDCRFVFLAERPTGDELSLLYGAVEDPLYEREEAGRLATFDAHLARVEWIVGPPNGRRLLDVGAYTGLAVEAAARRGWDAIGIEPSRWAVESGRRRDRRLILGTLSQLVGRSLGLFDVVTMWDVIEHLAEPEQVLTTAHGLIRPGGFVVVHTMDVDSLFARLAGRRWPWYMEMHLFYFSPATLCRMLRQAGFDPVHTEHRGRLVSVRYLASRIAALASTIGRPIEQAISWSGLGNRLIRVGFGDLFTVVARRPL